MRTRALLLAVLGTVVPIALHVDYRDYIGWKDPYARRIFSARQRKLAQLARSALVYTPQVLLQGREFRAWRSPAFDEAVARINRQPARARISLALEAHARDALEVEASAELAPADQAGGRPSISPATRAGLRTQVTAGENRGRLLDHEFVAWERVGPLGSGAGGRLVERRSLPLLPGAAMGNSGVVAFVQDRAGPGVLQALLVPACPG